MNTKKLVQWLKQGNWKKFYKLTIWLKKRAEILKRDNNECQRCKAEGSYSKANTVHHIKHLKDSPELALDDDNLVSLCNQCHNLEHPEKLGSLIKSKPKFMNEERWE